MMAPATKERTDLTANEVAVLSGVPPRVVRKAVEEQLLLVGEAHLPALNRTVRKALSAYAVEYMTVMREIDWSMPRESKSRIAEWIFSTKPNDLRGYLAIHGPLSLDVNKLASKIRAARRRTRHYRRARAKWITSDEGIMGGTPVIKGTRMTVYSVLGRLEGGDTIDQIAEENPDVSREALEAAAIFARANPMRGRPSGRPWTQPV